MTTSTQIILSKGGTKERTVSIDDAECLVPDMWHIINYFKDKDKPEVANEIDKCWKLCHDFKKHIQESK